MKSPRAFPLALGLGLLVALASPASAAIIELPEGKPVERALEPGKSTLFTIPLAIGQDGFLYVKLLVTPGNAVNSGTPNGSVEDGTGWRISYALARENGDVEELGTFVDSTQTRLVPVTNGERPTLLATVHVPEDAAKGGPSQWVYLAAAYRFGERGSDPGTTSGATMDESRSVSLLLSDALLPPPQPEEVVEPEPVEEDPDVSPVTPIDTSPQGQGQTVIVQSTLPTWFLVGVLLIGGAAVVFLALIAATLFLVLRDVRVGGIGPEARARRIPVQSKPSTEVAREFLRELESSKGER